VPSELSAWPTAAVEAEEAIESWIAAAKEWQEEEWMPRAFEGGCHCGRVRFRVAADLDGVTNCNCSICTKKGFLHLIVARDQFELISGKDSLTTYRFNTGVAQHMFCKHCGTHPFYVPRSDPDKIDVNLRCLDGIDLTAIKISEFDARNWEVAMQQEVPWR
jgi:hypothetical protein